jgi:RHS repeat-associated protein
VIYRRVFEPYGGVVAESTGSGAHERIFTGKREDVDTRDGGSGLANFGARWYDADIGRFLGVDPIVQTVSDPQTHNPYGYVRNNPVTLIDPDGRGWADFVQIGFAIVGMVMAMIPGLQFGAPLFFASFNAFGAGLGAVVGGDAGLGIALGTAMISSAFGFHAAANPDWRSVVITNSGPESNPNSDGEWESLGSVNPIDIDAASTEESQGASQSDGQVYTGAPDLPVEEAIGPIEIVTGVYGGVRVIYSGLRYGLPALGRWLANRGGREAVEEGGEQALKISPKIERHMARRGWTSQQVSEAVRSGKQVRAVNKATGNPATRYVNPNTGQSVVIDDVTGEVIHVGGPGFSYGPGSGDLP